MAGAAVGTAAAVLEIVAADAAPPDAPDSDADASSELRQERM